MKLKRILTGNGKKELPLVPLRELVVFPHMLAPFFAGRPATIRAIEEAMASDRYIFLVCQRNNTDTPLEQDFFRAGTVGKIVQMLKLPDGTLRVLVEGEQRGIVQKFIHKKDSSRIVFSVIEEDRDINPQITALMAAARKAYKRYADFQKKVAQDILESIEKAEYPDKLVDLIAANIAVSISKKIEILEKTTILDRLESLTIIIESENEVLELQNRIHTKVQKKLEKNQKEYFLNEQIRQINKELGNDDNDPTGSKELKRESPNPIPPKK